MVWETDFGDKSNLQGREEEGGEEEEDKHEDGSECDSDEEVIKKKKKTKGAAKRKKESSATGKKKDEMFETEDLDKGDEFMAVKPWLGAIKEPSEFKKSSQQHKPPNADLDLDYVFGYRAKLIFILIFIDEKLNYFSFINNL